MSKVNELRRKASNAVRARQFEKAIELYRKICQLEPSNGTPCNEMGDLYLKTGNTLDALESFSLSARLYCDFGLTNNAVAVLKKILRHDPNHLDSLWSLAEIRREQGMDAEASAGFMEFLSRADQVPEAGRDDFRKRAGELINTMGDDLEILSRLEEFYRKSDSGDDVARVLIAKALQAHIEGELEVRDRYIEHAREACAILDSLPAYQAYLAEVEPVRDDEPEADDEPTGASDEEGLIELGVDDDIAFDAGTAGKAVPEDSAPKTVMLDTDALDLGFDFEEEDLAHVVADSFGPKSGPGASSGEATNGDPDSPVPEQAPTGDATSGTLNLLEEILADDSFDVGEDQQRQVETIAEEMKGQIAGDVDPHDFGGQYELGVVYMDMGLFDQAVAAFEAASEGEDYRLGSLEMRGTCLLRLGRDGEALDSFREGLAIEGAPEKAYLGLLYGIGCCLELRGDADQAREYFLRVAAVDAKFLDVSSRLEASGEPR